MRNIDRLRDPGLLKQMVDYTPPGQHRAERIYHLCILRGHHKWASEISCKYGNHFYKSDIVMAFSMALAATKNNNL